MREAVDVLDCPLACKIGREVEAMTELFELPHEGHGLSLIRHGLRVTMRRVVLEDGPALIELLTRLSAQSIRLRYLIMRTFNPGTARAEAERMLRGRAGRTVT